MKIELKRIQYSERMSEETNAFVADLYIEGKKVGMAGNEGRGGPTYYRSNSPENEQLIREAEAYCKGLSPQEIPSSERFEGYTQAMNLEFYIGDLLDQHLNERELQKFRREIEKAAEKSLVIGVPDQSYNTLPLKTSIDMLLYPDGKKTLKDLLTNKVIPHLTDEKILLNTNIPEQILKEAGLVKGQYADPLPQRRQQRPQKKRGRGL